MSSAEQVELEDAGGKWVQSRVSRQTSATEVGSGCTRNMRPDGVHEQRAVPGPYGDPLDTYWNVGLAQL